MLAQRLRHRITVQQLIEAQDLTTGSVEESWTNVLTDEPAEVVPKSAREFYAAAEKQAETSGRITIRKSIEIDAKTMRVVWNGQNYQIDGVMPDPSNARWLTVLYSQGVNDGG